MVESPDRRDAVRQGIPQLGVDRHAVRFDAEFAKDRQQQRGLGLAIAVAARPGFFGAGGDQAARAHRQRHVTDAALHQSERGLGARDGIGRAFADALDLGPQRTFGWDLRGLFVKRDFERGRFGPRRKVARLDIADHRVTQRREARQRDRLDIFEREFRGFEAVFARPPPFGQVIGLGERDLLAGGPLQPPMHPVELPVERAHGDFAMSRQHRIARGQRRGEFEDVADLQPFGKHRGGERAVEHRLLEILLAAQDGERLARFEHVDRLVAASDDHFVDRQILGFRIPGERQVAAAKALRCLKLDGERRITRLLAVLEASLAVHREDAGGETVFLSGGRRVRLGLDPVGRGAEQDLVACRRRRGRHQANRERNSKPSDIHAQPPVFTG